MANGGDDSTAGSGGRGLKPLLHGYVAPAPSGSTRNIPREAHLQDLTQGAQKAGPHLRAPNYRRRCRPAAHHSQPSIRQ